MKSIIGILFVLLTSTAFSQITKKACFLGNSYTSFNNLPGLVESLATADGNTFVHDKNTPGGYWLEYHSTNATSLEKIAADDWDYVVLQEQSQKPSFPWTQFLDETYPYAEILCDSIRSANECAVPLFYNTWGRQNGDSMWDSINTFDKMNWRLHNAYHYMADELTGKNAPVGVGFGHIQDDGSAVVAFDDLYTGDGSHPSIYGSYLAACIFYEVIFETSSVGNTFLPSGVTVPEGAYLQSVANWVVNDVDSVTIDKPAPVVGFTYAETGFLEMTFTNTSEHAFSFNWDFGDGNTSNEKDPVHTYASYGDYVVTLEAGYCSTSEQESVNESFSLLSDGELGDVGIEIYPNPSNGSFVVQSNSYPLKYDILTLDGKVIQSGILSSNKTNLSVSSPGLYFLQAGSLKTKFVVR